MSAQVGCWPGGPVWCFQVGVHWTDMDSFMLILLFSHRSSLCPPLGLQVWLWEPLFRKTDGSLDKGQKRIKGLWAKPRLPLKLLRDAI